MSTDDAATEPGRTLCALADLVQGRGVAALVDSRQIAVFLLPGDVVSAVDNRDPFSGANVIARGLLGTDDEGAWYVASPLHKQRFRLADGRCLDDPSVALQTFTVAVDAGRCVLVP